MGYLCLKSRIFKELYLSVGEKVLLADSVDFLRGVIFVKEIFLEKIILFQSE